MRALIWSLERNAVPSLHDDVRRATNPEHEATGSGSALAVAVLAMIAGPRVNDETIPVPRRNDDVHPAASASGVIASNPPPSGTQTSV